MAMIQNPVARDLSERTCRQGHFLGCHCSCLEIIRDETTLSDLTSVADINLTFFITDN